MVHRILTAAAAGIVIVGALTVVPSAPALAHHALTDSTPMSGAQLDVAPSRISLTFAFDVRMDGAEIELVDEDGASWTSGDVEVDDTVVSVAVDPGARDGHYEARWSVTSFDGAPLRGVLPFAVGEAGSGSNPLNSVINDDLAAVIRFSAFGVIGALLGLVVHAIATTYGPSARKRPHSRMKKT
jgi:methionine-rich copper-binding protein CopC